MKKLQQLLESEPFTTDKLQLRETRTGYKHYKKLEVFYKGNRICTIPYSQYNYGVLNQLRRQGILIDYQEKELQQ